MNSNFDEIKEAEKLLQEGRYALCSIQCGRIIEIALRNLLDNYLDNISEKDRQLLKIHLPPSKKNSINHLTLGELTTLYEKDNGLRNFIRKHLLTQSEISFSDLNPIIVKIRNIATHNNYKDLDTEKADAHIIYGSLLRLRTMGLFQSIVKTKNIKEDVLEKPIKTSYTPKVNIIPKREKLSEENIVNPIQGSSIQNIEEKYLTVLKNNTSKKYFIFINEDYSNKNKALLVHPSGMVHSYSLNIFEAPEEKEAEYLLKHGWVEKKQYQQYINYKKTDGIKSSEDHKISKFLHLKPLTDKRPYGKKQVFPRGCTVDGNHYDSASEAVEALKRRGKLKTTNLPSSQYNAHDWLQRNMNHFNFSYRRDN